MIGKFARQRFGVLFTDDTGTRRWPPILVGRLPGMRRTVQLDPMRIGAILSLSAVVVGTLVGIWWFWRVGLTWFDVTMALFGVAIINIGVTIGYHRYFSHKSFEAKPWVVAMLGILGAMSMQGQIMTWASVHRRHHHQCDTPGDPHTPKSMGEGLKAMFDGFVAGYVGWTVTGRLFTYVDYVRDLRKDRVVRWVDSWYWLWVALGWIIPGLIGMAWYGGWTGYWSGFFAGGAIRSFLQLNSTGVVNTFGHLTGRRPFVTKDDSSNSVFVNLVSVSGEGLHNNHHAIPWSARFSMFKGDVDIGYWVLKSMERLGLVWDLKVPTSDYVVARATPATAQRDALQA
jgi:stearoyl-CoA desaturase (delta-9 desaturase)